MGWLTELFLRFVGLVSSLDDHPLAPLSCQELSPPLLLTTTMFARLFTLITTKLGFGPRENFIVFPTWKPLEIQVTTYTEYRIVPDGELCM